MDSPSDFLETTRDENGGNVIVYVFISSLLSQSSFCSAELSFVLCSFGCSLFGRLFGFRDFQQTFNGNGNEYNGCVSERYNSLFTSLPLFTKGHKQQREITTSLH